MYKLSDWAKVITGVMLIIIGAMIPSSIILPQQDLSLSINSLNINWQIQGLFLTSLVCGPRIGTICAICYLIIGLFYLPIFQGGGSIGYILTNEFGYLLGFIPAAWICGFLSKRKSKVSLINYSFCTIISLISLHSIGILYLVLGKFFGQTLDDFTNLILSNSLIVFPIQSLLCIAISLVAILTKRILLVK